LPCVEQVLTAQGEPLTFKDFVAQVVNNHPTADSIMKKQRSYRSVMSDLIYWMENTTAENFPIVKKNINLFSFNNGVYWREKSELFRDTRRNKNFTVYLDKVEFYADDPTLEKRLDDERIGVPRKHFDCDLSREDAEVRDWRVMFEKTNAFGNIFRRQEWSIKETDAWYYRDGKKQYKASDESGYLTQTAVEHTIFWIYFAIGRLLYRLNERDKLEFMIWLYGQSDSGKTTWLKAVIDAFFEQSDVGILGEGTHFISSNLIHFKMKFIYFTS
jgi:hypothetical protein